MSMSIQRKIFLGIKLVRIVALLLTSRFCVAAAPDVVSIWGGARGTIILKSDGTVWTWGANLGGKLGIGVVPATLGRSLVPVEVHGAGDVSFFNSATAIMAGETHNMALKSDGTLWSWGYN